MEAHERRMAIWRSLCCHVQGIQYISHLGIYCTKYIIQTLENSTSFNNFTAAFYLGQNIWGNHNQRSVYSAKRKIAEPLFFLRFLPR